ncbi:MAG: CRISPR-associated endonuclease Cas3'', partial [Candidatus Handelsmanbacteria bacterium RIFCSPLOWO2_12_FULL_64_10]
MSEPDPAFPRIHYAHTFQMPEGQVDPDRSKWQPLAEHLENVGGLASAFLAGTGLEDVARRAGERHDLGKYSCAFQRRLDNLAREGTEDASNEPQRVDHATAGAVQSLLDRYIASPSASLSVPSAELAAAFCIAFHHGGLQNREELRRRMQRQKEHRDEGRSTLLDDAIAGGVPERFLEASPVRLPAFLRERADSKTVMRRFEFAIRMVYSALLDADFLDTERSMRPDRHEARPNQEESMLARLRTSLDEWLDAKCSSTTDVNRVRREVLESCREAAFKDPGLFTLTVPTGGGKTLSSLAFALRHAERKRLRRVVVVIPYTSIIDQTASEYRSWLSQSGIEGASTALIEHHSGLDPGRETLESRLACENWDAPLIVTTSVQFFESLHARKSSSVRKLHRLARSVVVLDEVQTLAPDLLQPCLDVLGHLVRDYGTTCVISTATQPALLEDIVKPGGVEKIEGLQTLIGRPAEEIVPGHKSHFETLNRRVHYHWGNAAGEIPSLSWDELAERLTRLEHGQGMAIVNTRGDARALFERLRKQSPHARHLSALMCPKHRRRTLDEVRKALVEGQPCLLAATQLVEAGVNLDFPTVYRAVAGLDSIVQAGGRCNREGSRPSGDVFIFA